MVSQNLKPLFSRDLITPCESNNIMKLHDTQLGKQSTLKSFFYMQICLPFISNFQVWLGSKIWATHVT